MATVTCVPQRPGPCAATPQDLPADLAEFLALRDEFYRMRDRLAQEQRFVPGVCLGWMVRRAERRLVRHLDRLQVRRLRDPQLADLMRAMHIGPWSVHVA